MRMLINASTEMAPKHHGGITPKAPSGMRNYMNRLTRSTCNVLGSATLAALLISCGSEPEDSSSSVSSTASSELSSSSSTSSQSVSSSSVSVSLFELQEEQAGTCDIDGVVETDHLGYTGNGYANGRNANGSTMAWHVLSSGQQQSSLTVHFGNGGAESRPSQLKINGATVANFTFSAADAWDTWQTETVQVSLSPGDNTIELVATTANGMPNIDKLELSANNLTRGDCSIVQRDITVWLAGDSTMANGQTPCPAGWGKFLQNYFTDNVTVRNSAAGGRSVRTWLYDVQDSMTSSGECTIGYESNGSPTLQARWQTMLQEMRAGDYILIQFGINDGSRTCPRHVGSQAFKDAFAYMAEEAQARGVQPIFLTPVSAIRCSGSVAVATRGFLSETFDIGNALSIPVLDLHAKSIDVYNQAGFCPAPGDNNASAATTQPGPIGDFFCDDHTHFDNPGADRIARAVAEMIRENNLSLSRFLNNL